MKFIIVFFQMRLKLKMLEIENKLNDKILWQTSYIADKILVNNLVLKFLKWVREEVQTIIKTTNKKIADDTLDKIEKKVLRDFSNRVKYVQTLAKLKEDFRAENINRDKVDNQRVQIHNEYIKNLRNSFRLAATNYLNFAMLKVRAK